MLPLRSHFLSVIDWPQLTDFLLLLEFANSVVYLSRQSDQCVSMHVSNSLSHKVLDPIKRWNP